MMDVFSFVALYATPKKYNYDFEQTEHWLDENIFPKMIDAAQSGMSSLNFIIDQSIINLNNIIEVFEKKGYDVEYWPVVGPTRHHTIVHTNIKVSW